MSNNFLVKAVYHPLVQHKLSLMRRKQTGVSEFRHLLREVSMLLAFEATQRLELTMEHIQTPLEEMECPVLGGFSPCLVPILRAGEGMLSGFLDVMPSASVGHIGLYRDTETLEAKDYYLKMPKALEHRDVFLLDPMLATGHSAIAAANHVKMAKSVTFVCLIAAPEGLAAFGAVHPSVRVVTAAIDRELSERAYILPGLGDAGDRLHGT